MRVGIGYDVHQLAAGRLLVLGGVEVPFNMGLAGYSDADVLLHAVMDALLGAAGAGDIGRHFPDSDPRYKEVSSLFLLARVAQVLAVQGLAVGNIDAVVVAQAPRLVPYIPQMELNIAGTLGIAPEQVNVKATTTEWLGFTGRGEGIAAYAISCLLKS